MAVELRTPSYDISIHALREEGDKGLHFHFQRLKISIHALREEGDVKHPDGYGRSGISIHALREEGDMDLSQPCTATGYFYPRPPRGGRLVQKMRSQCFSRFLSTPSARRATVV